jgi:hypothetical protein
MHTNTIKHETWGLVEIDSFFRAAQQQQQRGKKFCRHKSRPNPKTETGKLSGV